MRRAFSLIELLLVITVIGMLVALLLPAIQAATEAARRTSCHNNLRQLGVALVMYHDTHNVFPPGWIVSNQSVEEAEWGWPVMLLPFLEQVGLHEQLSTHDRRLWDVIRDPMDRRVVQTELGVFRCPSDNAPALLPGGAPSLYFQPPYYRHFHCRDCPDSPIYEVAVSNYIGVSGLYDRPANMSNNGVLFGNSRIRMDMITDGLSHTLAIGERDSRCRAGAWCGVRNTQGSDMWGTYYVHGRVSISLNADSPEVVGSSNSCAEGFSSPHPGGTVFARCDGSVTFLGTWGTSNPILRLTALDDNPSPPTIDVTKLDVLQSLGIRNDGEVQLDW